MARRYAAVALVTLLAADLPPKRTASAALNEAAESEYDKVKEKRMELLQKR